MFSLFSINNDIEQFFPFPITRESNIIKCTLAYTYFHHLIESEFTNRQTVTMGAPAGHRR